MAAAAIVCATPAAAFALPTPDMLVGVLQTGPAVVAVASGMFAALALRFRRFVEGRSDAHGWLAASAVTFAALWAATSLYVLHGWLDRSSRQRLADAAAYLRCDLPAHEAQHAEAALAERLDALGRWIDVAEIDARLRSDSAYEPMLLTVSFELRYDAGFLVVGPEARRRRFTLVHIGALEGLLSSLPAASRRSQDVVVEYPPHLFVSPAIDQRLIELMLSFERLRFLRQSPSRRPLIHVREDDGRLRRAAVTLEPQRDWPVRTEWWVYEERHVRFPGMTTLIPASDLARYLDDPEVVVLAPFNSRHRTRGVHLEYVARLLRYRLAPAERAIVAERARDRPRLEAALERRLVKVVDFSSPSYAADAARVVEAVRGRRFIVLAVTKYDWVYFGLNLAYLAHRDARATGAPFRYLGGTLQAAEMVAARMVAERTEGVVAAGLRRGRAALAGALGALTRRVTGAMGLSLLVVSLALRLSLWPVTVRGARAGRIAREVRAAGLAMGARGGAEPGPAGTDFVLARFGTSRSWEVASALATLLLLAPAYQLLGDARGPLRGERLLWVADLAAPDPALAVMLAAAVAARLAAGGMGSRRRRGALAAACGVGLAFPLATVPAAVLVYAVVVVAVAGAADLAAAVTARRVRHLLAPLRPAPALARHGHAAVVALEDLRPGEVGPKGERLGLMRRMASPLFRVPPGVVVRHVASGRPDLSLRDGLAALARDAGGACWAVRSCGRAEDGRSSLAGRFDSVLDVPLDGVAEAIERVRESYRRHGAADEAVVVQAMADADVAGVLFTRSPRNGAVAEIEYVRGRADRLLGGTARPGRALVSRRSLDPLPIGDAAGADGGPGTDAAPAGMIAHVCLAGALLEEFFGAPQDIEWCYSTARRELAIVQSRDVTAFTYDPAVHAEQERVLAADKGGRARSWRRCEATELAAGLGPLVLSLLREAYGRDHGLGAARRVLGLGPAELQVEEVFGRLYAAAAPAGARARIAGLVRRARTRRRLQRCWRKRSAEIRDALRRLPAAVPPSGSRAEDVARAIDATLASWMDEALPPAFEAALAAETVMTAADRKRSIATAETAYYEALARLSVGGNVEEFLERWGHRAARDYDLATPSFAEDPASALAYARRFTGLRPGAGDPADGDDAFSAFVRLREEAKDAALRQLRSVRPLVLRLADALRPSPAEAVFGLTLDDLRDLAGGRLDACEARGRAASNAQRLRALAAVPLPDRFGVAEVEALRFGGAADGSEPSGGAALRGELLSAARGFSGAVVLEPPDPDAGLEPPVVLVTTALTPDLVGSFGRIAGLITESGGYLSHAAVVAREMGVPVLRLEGARRLLGAGVTVRVTSSGGVEVPRPAPPASAPAGAEA